MKKISILATMVAALGLFSCENNEERAAQTIFVHFADDNGGIITLNPNNTAVFFFNDNGKDIDYTSSNPSFNDHKLTYTDGTYSEEAVIYDSGEPGVYRFENVPNGQYILWVHYYPYSTGWQSSKKIVVNNDSHLMIETKVFKGGSRYEEW